MRAGSSQRTALETVDKVLREDEERSRALIQEWTEAVAHGGADKSGPTIPVEEQIPRCMADCLRRGILMGLPMSTLSALQKLILFGAKTGEERAVLGISPRHLQALVAAELVSEGPLRTCSVTGKAGRATMRAEPQQLSEEERKKAKVSILATRAQARQFLVALRDHKNELARNGTPDDGGPKLYLLSELLRKSYFGKEMPDASAVSRHDLRIALEEIGKLFKEAPVPEPVVTLNRWLTLRCADLESSCKRIVFWPEEPSSEQQGDHQG